MFKGFGKVILSIVISIAASAASAGPTTWTFSGLVSNSTDGSRIGRIVSGSVVFDISMLYVNGTDGNTYNQGTSIYYPPHTTQPLISGSATDGVENVSVGGGDLFDRADVIVIKGSPVSLGKFQDEFLITAESRNTNSQSYIQIQTFDYTNGVLASGIFDNSDYSNPDLSFDQNVNWLSAGATSGGIIQFASGQQDTFILTSMTVTTNGGVPEPATIALVGLAIAGMGVATRRHSASRPFKRDPLSLGGTGLVRVRQVW